MRLYHKAHFRIRPHSSSTFPSHKIHQRTDNWKNPEYLCNVHSSCILIFRLCIHRCLKIIEVIIELFYYFSEFSDPALIIQQIKPGDNSFTFKC